MSAALMAVALVLCALIAWFASKDGGAGGHSPIDLDRAAKVFLCLTNVLLLGLFAHASWSRDDRLDRTLDVTRSVAVNAARCVIEVDSAIAAVDALVARLGP